MLTPGRLALLACATVAALAVSATLIGSRPSNRSTAEAYGPISAHVIHGAGASTSHYGVGPNAGSGQSAVFYVSGDVSGLYPGSSPTTQLVMSVRNPFSFQIHVTSLAFYVGDASTSCPASNFLVVVGSTTYTGSASTPINVPESFYVPSGQALPAPGLPVYLAGGAPAACVGGSFPLTYGGTATQ